MNSKEIVSLRLIRWSSFLPPIYVCINVTLPAVHRAVPRRVPRRAASHLRAPAFGAPIFRSWEGGEPKPERAEKFARPEVSSSRSILSSASNILCSQLTSDVAASEEGHARITYAPINRDRLSGCSVDTNLLVNHTPTSTTNTTSFAGSNRGDRTRWRPQSPS